MIADEMYKIVDELLNDFMEVYDEYNLEPEWLDVIPRICYFLVTVRRDLVSEKALDAERDDMLIHNYWLKLYDIRKTPWKEEHRAFGLDLIESFLYKIVLNPFRWRMNQI